MKNWVLIGSGNELVKFADDTYIRTDLPLHAETSTCQDEIASVDC